MKKIILFLLLSVSIFGKLNMKVIYSDPADTGLTMERTQNLNSEEFESSLKEDIKDEKTIKNESNEKVEYLVYVTKSGKKYHEESCRYNKNTTVMSMEKARNLGLEACKVCKP